ncbi:MAG: hypothetical protein IJD67_06495, partial [Clostridia bacterium]|nr:hypothetical protein [Clostridia bacterium]
MRRNDERNSALTTIIVIASAIVVAAGVIMAFKLICDKYKITEKKPKHKFIDFDDADDWMIDECECGDTELDALADELVDVNDDVIEESN